ncbi:hypothetical protein JCM11672_27370 [Alkaliphilus crotonatoxidans]
MTEPLPRWLITNKYYGDLGFELMRNYVGDLLLEITIPIEFPGLYIAEYAHILEYKMKILRNETGIGVVYNCSNGKESTQAYVHSYIPLSKSRMVNTLLHWCSKFNRTIR